MYHEAFTTMTNHHIESRRLETEKKQKIDELKVLIAKIDCLKETEKELDNRIAQKTEKEEDLEKIKNEIVCWKKLADISCSNIEALVEEEKQRKAKIDGMNIKIKELQTTTDLKNEELLSLENRKLDITRELKNMNDQNEKLKIEINSLKLQEDQMRQKITKSHQELLDLQTKLEYKTKNKGIDLQINIVKNEAEFIVVEADKSITINNASVEVIEIDNLQENGLTSKLDEK
jgi:chromosome segregation ATPase